MHDVFASSMGCLVQFGRAESSGKYLKVVGLSHPRTSLGNGASISDLRADEESG
jgi:hypothetical protein